ncbi:hypothetical protein Hdeb2414_s0014g00425451 [Helianthus debilis subsp. tardiflorus]
MQNHLGVSLRVPYWIIIILSINFSESCYKNQQSLSRTGDPCLGPAVLAILRRMSNVFLFLTDAPVKMMLLMMTT